MKRILYSTLILILLISIFIVSQALANGVLLESVGTTSTGRGATDIAYSDNGIMVHNNPAGLADLEDDRIEITTELISFSMHYQDPQNDEEGKEPLCFLPSLFYMKHFDEIPLGIGFGIFSSAGYSTDYDLVHLDPNYGTQKYFSYSSLSKLLVGAGYKIKEGFSLGMGIGASYSKVELEMPYTFQTGAMAGTPALINMDADDWSYTWNMGAKLDISSKTSLGVTYRSKDSFDMHGDLDLNIPGLGAAHYAVDFDFCWPQSAGIGILHHLTQNHRLSFDVVWIDWSSAFDDLTLKLSNGNNVAFPLEAKDTLPLAWKDSYSFRLGYEQLLTPVDTLRLGYIYIKNPVPDDTLTPMIPGILTNMITIGYGREWKNWIFNLAYLYAFSNTQSVGTSRIIGGDFDSSSVKESLHCFSFGIAYRL
ncbi:MAG: OmpP1/FadL family transporter [bacterium]